MVQVRARYDGKVLIPAEPLDVPAGTDVDLDVHEVDDSASDRPDESAAAKAEALERALATADWDEADFIREMEKNDPPPPDFVRKPGSAKGLFTVPDDFDEPLEEFEEYM